MSARIVTLSLHDALPIFFGVVKNIGRADDVMKKSVRRGNAGAQRKMIDEFGAEKRFGCKLFDLLRVFSVIGYRDRKSTRLNSSHRCSSYAVFCLKKKNYS